MFVFYLPIHVKYINVTKVENNKEESIINRIEAIQKLTVIENNLINNETPKAKMYLSTISDLPFNQHLIDQSIQIIIKQLYSRQYCKYSFEYRNYQVNFLFDINLCN